jgi:hypothetical protein
LKILVVIFAAGRSFVIAKIKKLKVGPFPEDDALILGLIRPEDACFEG